MKSFSLHELTVYVKRAVAINFQEYCWVNAEILNARDSKGHIYLQLVQQNEEKQNIAKCDAILWKSQRQWLKQKHDIDLSDSFETGKSCNILVDVSYDELYGLQLHIKDIDINFTLGELEKQRRATIERILSEKLDRKNKALLLPKVLQRIAIISSKNAAGFIDFCNELRDNSIRLKFELQHFHASMQGKSVTVEFKQALERLDTSRFDCLVYVRGGGSKFDLSAFDDYMLAEAVANCRLPVIVGIGHEIDSSAVDLVAHTSLKTPTAAATFILEHNTAYLNRILDINQDLKRLSKAQVEKNTSKMEYIKLQINALANMQLNSRQHRIQQLKVELYHHFNKVLQNKVQWLMRLKEIVKLSSPEEILKKGYSLTRKDGKIIRSISEAASGETIVTELKDGNLTSTIQ